MKTQRNLGSSSVISIPAKGLYSRSIIKQLRDTFTVGAFQYCMPSLDINDSLQVNGLGATFPSLEASVDVQSHSVAIRQAG